MERRSIVIRGIVQGVGFRPFVYGLAQRLKLSGAVWNRAGDVRVEVEGEADGLDAFIEGLTIGPALARIDQLVWEPQATIGERGFRIERSDGAAQGRVAISPDVATCDDCLAELFDPRDRRYRYPFLNCTNCGPRLTIVTGVPYDRDRTTMAGFPMCEACLAEYEDPGNRRFHAQPTACAACGPRLSAADGHGKPIEEPDPLRWFARALLDGKVGAMKGLGGYHLACDAGNRETVAALRSRKHREEKPFAVMARDLAAAEAICEVTEEERALLTSPARPIVLLQRRPSSDLADGVAPGNPRLGVMLPYTPLHHLLLREVDGRPLAMTSGNRSDEPIATGEPDCFEQLAGIADLFLTHNRPIHTRCDDSVTRMVGLRESPVRRSRGYAPRPVRLPVECPAPILAVGGQMKATFALGTEGRAILSHHVGDLDHFAAYRAFERDVARYEKLFATKPRWIAHDAHPDYASTRYAVARAAAEGIGAVAVQHHHAHMASCIAEHAIAATVLGVSFDGTGYGADGAIWGGEFLLGDLRGFRRVAHLRYVPMPGGERAVKEPWRMAVAHLADAGIGCTALRRRIDPAAWRTVHRVLERRLNAPLTSSAGRLFDAVASIAGVRDRVTFEGQAAMQLEWLASGDSGEVDVYPYELVPVVGEAPMQIDTRPLIAAVAVDADRGVSAGRIARRFHHTLAEIVARVCEIVHEGVRHVTLSGGVFMNVFLLQEATKRLEERGFLVFHNSLVPPNDGGLSFGQLAVAARQLHGA